MRHRTLFRCHNQWNIAMPADVIVAVFENRERASQAASELISAGIPQNAIQQFDQQHPARGEWTGAEPSAPRQSFWEMLFGGDDGSVADHQVFEDSVQKGGTVLSVSAAPDMHQRVMSTLERFDPIDLDERSKEFGGMQSRARATEPGLGVTSTAPLSEQVDAQTATGAAGGLPQSTEATGAAGGLRTGTETTGRIGAPGEGEQVIPLAEEQLQVGKRMVETGRTRIRRYVVETPVEERVRLRTERVVIERRQPVSGRDASPDAFTETETDITEREETPVVQKTARVGEEVVVRREEGEREETVRDTVRKQDVEVTRDGETEQRAHGAGAMPAEPERTGPTPYPTQRTGTTI
jgi:uncharacterized protein (TIGR02271 family)